MFCGWLGFGGDDSPPAAEEIISSLDPFQAAANRGGHTTQVPPLAMAETSRSSSCGPVVDPDSGNCLVGWLVLNNRIGLCRQLGDAGVRLPPDSGKAGDGSLVLAGYTRWGRDVVHRLRGEFSFAIWDATRRLVFMARDPTGRRPLYFTHNGRCLAFASTEAALRGLPGVSDDPNPLWMANYLVGNPGEADGPGALTGTRRLPPGHWAEASEAGLTQQQYFAFRDDSPWETQLDPDWLHRYRGVLDGVVQRVCADRASLGVETSGGLDSSTLVALAACERASAVQTFGYATTEQESRLILATSAKWGVYANHIFTKWSGGGPDEVRRRRATLSRIAGHPSRNSSVVGHWDLMTSAREQGISTLLSGFGGDEAVTSHAFAALTEFVEHKAWSLLAMNYPSRPAFRPIRGAGWLLSTFRARTAEQEGAGRGPSPQRVALVRSTLGADFAERVLSQEAVVSRPTHPIGSETVNREVLNTLRRRSAMARVEETAQLATVFGIEYQWPLLEVESRDVV